VILKGLESSKLHPYINQASSIQSPLPLSNRKDMNHTESMNHPTTMPAETTGGIVISVSSVFYPAAALPGPNNKIHPDLIVYTSDPAFFYCHQTVLRSRSSNSFDHLVPASAGPSGPDSGSSISVTQPIIGHGADLRTGPVGEALSLRTITVPESSAVLNVILHIAYNIPVARFAPDLLTIAAALDGLAKYGLPTPEESNDVWSLLVKHAASDPFRAYALAASHNMEPICVKISPYTLAVPFESLSEADAIAMGPSYLRRLVLLNFRRKEELRLLLEKVPEAHEACGEARREEVGRAWALAVTNTLVRPMSQNMSPDELREIFAGVKEGCGCDMCVKNIESRVDEVVSGWEAVQRTI